MRWFRARADVYRWLEQVESKHAQFIRCLKAFSFHAGVWELAATESHSSSPGHAAFARRQDAIFKQLQINAKEQFHEVAHPMLYESGSVSSLSRKVTEFRSKLLNWLEEMVILFYDYSARDEHTKPFSTRG